MALDLRYVLAYTFGKYFVDKDTGAPLSAGVLTFYKDQARTIPKPVYILSGAPPNYSYVSIGNEVTLNSTGMPQYLGANVALYFFPYDDAGNFELYYYTVYSAGSILQFVREGQPNVASQVNPSGTVNENFVPNPQFLFHNDLAATDGGDGGPIYQVGEIRQPVTDIAQGGWTFERPISTTSDDFVTFEPFTTFITSPDGDPRFSVRIVNTTPDSGDGIKDLRLKYTDVHRFASLTQFYSWCLWAKNNTAGSITLQLYLIKNFGTNGSPSTENNIGSITFNAGWQQVQVPFLFGTNVGETIGTDNDDFLQLAIRMPLTAISDVSFTNFILDEGNLVNVAFPVTTDSQMSVNTTYVPTTDPAGMDLFLTRKSNLQGDFYDRSEIGDIIHESQISLYDETTGFHPTTNRVMAKGIQYETISYSPLGIPMLRLQQKYFDTTLNTPRYGTGTSYFTGYYSGSGNELVLTNNSPGLVTATSDGAIPTGFTFANIHLGATSYFVRSAITTGGGDTFWIEDTNVGEVDAPDPKNSGFVIVGIQAGNNVGLLNIISVNVTALPLASTRFWFSSVDNSFAPVNYYVWFKIDGVGTDPADALRTGILVNLSATDTVITAAEKIREALNGWQNSSIKTVAASSITGGSYFNATSITPATATQLYVVWYEVNGVGTQPVVSNALYIKVTLTGTETNAQVAIATQNKINMKYFSTPDYRNAFLRMLNDGKVSEEQLEGRFSLVPGMIVADTIGTMQLSDNLDHRHSLEVDGVAYASITSVDNGNLFFNGGAGGPFYAIDGTGFILNPLPTDPDLFHFESRPPNIFVNCAIKY